MAGTVNMRRKDGRRSSRCVVLAVMALLLLLLGACGDDSTDGAAARPAGDGDEGGDTFPVTLEQSTGTVTIDEKPRRVVTLGYTDTDIASALGAQIVAAVASPFGSDGVNPPWATSPLDDAATKLDPLRPSIEAIAAADPDVILATTAYPSTLEMYDLLSEIAPVVAPIKGILLDSPEELTLVIGSALGETAAAEALIADAHDAIDAFRAKTPGLEGKTVVFAPREGERTALFIDGSAASVTLLGQLGLTTPREVQALPGDRIFGATFISDEQLDLLDTADIAIVGLYTPDARSAFLALPTVTNLSVQRDGRLIPIDRTIGAALQTPNPVSVHYLLAELGPQLAAAAR